MASHRASDRPVRIPAPSVSGEAAFSDCRSYRWWLTRIWDHSADLLVFIMLNPSTADASTDDPTIRRCVGFARRLGHGGICVVNLYVFRATSPRRLAGASDPVGSQTDFWLTYAAARARKVVCAWGANAKFRRGRTGDVLKLLRGHPSLMCLGRTKDGQPRHPLYVRADQPLMEYDVAQ